MLEWLKQIVLDGTLAPHGICLLWRPELVWTHAVSDAIIASSYFAIPVGFAYLDKKRPDLSFGKMSWVFASFITLCGWSHLVAMLTLWYPIYEIEALVKAATALVSIGSAMFVWYHLPAILKLPSPKQYREMIAERDEALEMYKREVEEKRRVETMLTQFQKMEALGQLTGGVAHDFNNLLNIVVMSMDRVRRSTTDPKILRNIDCALQAVDRGAKLTSHMLAFARQQPDRKQEVVVDEIAINMKRLVEHALRGKAALLMDLQAGDAAVDVDVAQMETAVLNLVVNARDSIQKQNGTVLLSTWVEGQDACVSVSDDGCGMPPEVVERCLEPFYTTKPIGHGTGLGLSQVYTFADKSGGTVQVRSELGKGTTVTIRLKRGARHGQDQALEGASSRG